MALRGRPVRWSSEAVDIGWRSTASQRHRTISATPGRLLSRTCATRRWGSFRPCGCVRQPLRRLKINYNGAFCHECFVTLKLAGPILSNSLALPDKPAVAPEIFALTKH